MEGVFIGVPKSLTSEMRRQLRSRDTLSVCKAVVGKDVHLIGT